MNKINFISCDSSYEESNIVIFGVPFDSTVSFRPGARFAPNAIRLDSDGIETYSPYLNKDIEELVISDIGDVEVIPGNVVQTLDNIYDQTRTILNDNKFPFMIGGEHLISLPSIKAVHEKYPELRIIHLDAHTDLRNDYLGEELSHATVMKRVHDLVGDNRIFHFGIRSGLKEEFQFANEHNYIERFTVGSIKETANRLRDFPVYITLDLDVLDPSIMCGTGTPEAGGLTFKELHSALISLKELNIVGCDIVELAPNLDQSGASTAVANKLIREMLLLI